MQRVYPLRQGNRLIIPKGIATKCKRLGHGDRNVYRRK